MNRIIVAILFTCLAIASAGPVTAGSIRDSYEKGKGKYFTIGYEKAKVYCVCFSGDANNGRIGVLREWSPNRAACYFLGFNADGGIISESPCNGTFTVVGK